MFCGLCKKWWLVVILILVLIGLYAGVRLKDDFWFHEYTYKVDGYYEDDSPTEFLTGAAIHDGVHDSAEALKDVRMNSGHFVTFDSESGKHDKLRFRIKLKNPIQIA